MKLKVIITGATGMVGEGVLIECLAHPDVESILLINRKPSHYNHSKIKEILHNDFFNLTPIADQLGGYNACFFNLGVTSIGKKEPEFNHLTYDLTLHMASILASLNTDMTFCYVSGSGTDSSERGRIMWARVKGKTENALMALPFKAAYMFRPGFMLPTTGQKNALKYYKYFNWMYPALRLLFPNFVSTLKELGIAMINAALQGNRKCVVEVKDIVKLSK